MARNFVSTSTDRVQITSTDTTPTTVSFSAWVNMTTYAGDTRLWTQTDSTNTNTYYAVYAGTGPPDRIAWWAPAWTTTDGEWYMTGPSTGVWAHVLLTYDGSSTANNPVMYLNGVSATVTRLVAPAGTLGTTTMRHMLGNNNNFTRGLGGSLCEVGVWNRILTATEIAALAGGDAPTFFPNGLLLYRSLRGANNPEREPRLSTLGANTIDGIVTGTTVTAHYDGIVYPPTQEVFTRTRPRPFAPGLAR